MPEIGVPDSPRAGGEVPVRKARVFFTALAIILTSSLLASAQSAPHQPDPMALLQGVQSTYRSMSTFSATLTVDTDMTALSIQQTVETPTTIQASSSGQMRVVSTGAAAMTMVNDGKSLWIYSPALNKYAKMPAGTSPASGARRGASPEPAANTRYFGEFKTVAANVKDATVLRTETVNANGSSVPCWVVLVHYRPLRVRAASAQGPGAAGPGVTGITKTYWVGQKDFLVYREDSSGTVTMPNINTPIQVKQSVRYETISINQPIAEGTFRFTPPAGATQMDLSSLMPGSSAAKQ